MHSYLCQCYTIKWIDYIRKYFFPHESLIINIFKENNQEKCNIEGFKSCMLYTA